VRAKLRIGVAKSRENCGCRVFGGKQLRIENLKKVDVTFSPSDNGKEFALFKELERSLGLKVYFAHPYTSWERGLNENTNGLIRQYFPKQTDFANVSHQAVAKVEWKLNNRPRKCLGYRTPEEVLAMSLSCPAGVALQI